MSGIDSSAFIISVMSIVFGVGFMVAVISHLIAIHRLFFVAPIIVITAIWLVVLIVEIHDLTLLASGQAEYRLVQYSDGTSSWQYFEKGKK